MSRVTFWFKDKEGYVNVNADMFLENDGRIKAYDGNEVVAMFDSNIVGGVYKTEDKK